jgi:hypothetical protein
MRTLIRITALLFLLSYFPSSFVTTQYRAVREAQRVMRAAAGGNVQISNGNPSSLDNYPRYRDAKKAGFDFGFRSAFAVDLAPQIGKREFTPSRLYWQTHHALNVSSVRAPPPRQA